MNLKTIALAGITGFGLLACTAEQAPAKPADDPAASQPAIPAADLTVASLELDKVP